MRRFSSGVPRVLREFKDLTHTPSLFYHNILIIYSLRRQEQIQFREYLLPFSSLSFRPLITHQD
jgi:hypothetical protein